MAFGRPAGRTPAPLWALLAFVLPYWPLAFGAAHPGPRGDAGGVAPAAAVAELSASATWAAQGPQLSPLAESEGGVGTPSFLRASGRSRGRGPRCARSLAGEPSRVRALERARMGFALRLAAAATGSWCRRATALPPPALA